MATNSARGLRRSLRLKKPPVSFSLGSAKKTPKEIPRRMRRSPRLKNASFCENEQFVEEEVKDGKISSVEQLLVTGFLDGVRINCFSEDRQDNFPGVIKDGGFVCGCSQCNYNGEVLSAKMFEKHAGASTKFQTDHIFLRSGLNLYKVSQLVRNIPEEDLCVKMLKLRADLKQKELSEEPPWETTKSVTARRSKRKRRETGFQRSNANVSKIYTNDELEKDKSSEGSNHLQMSSEGSRQVLKFYKRYHPERLLMDVQGLLSTGLLEGFKVTYKRNEARLEAEIQGAGYRCGCSSCNYTKVITAREIERHAGELSNNPNENIYLDNDMTLYKLMTDLKGMPLYLLGGFLQEKIKCPPNSNSFEIWKGSFKMIDHTPNFRSNLEKQPEVNSKHSSVQCKLMDEVSISEAAQNIDKTVDIFHVRNDDSLQTLDSGSDQILNQPIESTNSNFQHCLVSEPIIVSNLDEKITDNVPEGINDLSKDSDPRNIFLSKSKDEASFSEATKNNWMGISSDMRDNINLENLNSNSGQSLNQPNESTNLNSQQFSAKPTIVTDPAEAIIDGQSEGLNDLAEASMPKNTFHPYNVKFNTPGSSGLDPPGPSNSEGMTVVHKDSLNISGDEWHLGPTSRKRRSTRNIKFMKSNYNFHVCRSSLVHGNDGFETTVQKVKLKSSGMESKASDVTEAATVDPDYISLQSGSKVKLTDEEKASLRGIASTRRGRDVYLHKRILEEGGLPDGTVLTYQYHNKVLITGVKEGSAIKCACHNLKFAPSQFEAHAGMGQRRQPYRHIYNSDGKTLHELSLELPDIPRPSAGLYSRPVIHLQHKRRERTARSIVKKDLFVPTRHRLKRVLLSQKGVLVHCTACKESRATLGDAADPKLLIFCNQCDRGCHIGCLEDQESFRIEDVLSGNWFCCVDCIWVHNSLKNMCALGAKPVPTAFFDLLKKPRTPVNLSWQIFRGGNTEDHALLSQSLQFLKSVFKPILLGRQDMIRQMVFGKQVSGTGLDFRGVLFIMIKLDEEIVSMAVLRVFGKYTAELPLVTTSKIWRQQGYFRMLLSLIEELLHLLEVRILVSPVHDKMQSLWIDKFGFVKASDQKVDMLKEQHGVMLFEDTALLEKEIQAVAD